MICFLVILILVFGNAILRKLDIPIQWASDISQLLFSYLAFFGADIALRKGSLIGVDILTKKLPPKVRNSFFIVCYLLMTAFLLIIIWYGFPLAIRSWKRSFHSLHISYSWITLSLPVSAVLMIMSIIHNFVVSLKTSSEKGV